MKIGIVSDTHDRLENTAAALRLLGAAGAEIVLHCGDIESPDTVRLFAGWPAHFVLGNCDWNPQGLRYAVAEIAATLHEPFGELDLAGAKIAWAHGHEKRVFEGLEQADKYDYLFYGHTHVAEQHRTGRTLVVNPGALHRVAEKTCVLLDLPTGELTTIRVPVAKE
ncbi:MAG: YfcE family phosphodiesterase [Gemmataceae bacterium]